MFPALEATLALPGFIWLSASYVVAGVVRGFSGFGTALIIVPVAGTFLQPIDILVMITVTGLVTNFLVVPVAWQNADRGEVGILALGALLGIPLGLWLVGYVDVLFIRWLVVVISVTTIISVALGWQFRRRLAFSGLSIIGVGAGFIGGMTALTGPIAILFYLANARRAVAVRANMMLFLAALDVLLMLHIGWQGNLSLPRITLGLALCLPYTVGILIGMMLFDPARERAYRMAALSIAGIAVLTGLPVWS